MKVQILIRIRTWNSWSWSRQIVFLRKSGLNSGTARTSGTSGTPETSVISLFSEDSKNNFAPLFKLNLSVLNQTTSTTIRRNSFQSLRPPRGPFPYLRKRSSLSNANQAVEKMVASKSPQDLFEEKMSYLDAKLAKLQVSLNASEKQDKKKFACKRQSEDDDVKKVTPVKRMQFNLANFREKFNLPPRSNCHDMVLITAKGQQLHVSSKFRNCYYIDTLDGVLVIVKCWHLVSKHRRFACFLKVLSVRFFVYHAKSREWMRIDLYTRLFSITFLHYFCWYFFFWYLSLYFPLQFHSCLYCL